MGTAVAVLVAAFVFASPAQASFHEIRITEIFPGTSQVPEAQFVELQMYSPNQTQTTGQKVIIYDESGIELAAFTFPRDMPNGATQTHILVATPEAEDLFGVTSDLGMSDEIIPEGGKVCWGTDGFLVDCASWGGYMGGDAPNGGQAGPPFNPSQGLVLGQSMTRKTSGGTDPSGLDAADDTNNSANDFQFAAPTPQNNGPAVEPSTSPTATTPPVTQHDRIVSLKLSGKLVASGKIDVEDDFAGCLSSAPVAIQKKSGRKFKTIKSTSTDRQGAYSVKVPNKPGTYRSKAKGFPATSTDNCVAVKSKQVHH